MAMPAYCLFDVTEVTDPPKLERYREGVLETVERFGGRYLTVGGHCEGVEGTWCPVFPVWIEFPSLERAYQWYNSEVYKPLKELRLASTRGHAVFVEGTPFRR